MNLPLAQLEAERSQEEKSRHHFTEYLFPDTRIFLSSHTTFFLLPLLCHTTDLF